MDHSAPPPPLHELAATEGVTPEIVANWLGADDVFTSSESAPTVTELISDQYVNQAIGACCTDYGRLLVPKPVKQLIARLAPADRPTMNAIPQDQRRQFLNELAAITGRALPPEELNEAEPNLANQETEPLVNGIKPIGVEPALAYQDARPIANGYEPIAVKGKVPVAKGWNVRPSTNEAVATERAGHPGATNTGLRTGRLVGVDIDIVPAEHVRAIKLLAAQVLGYASLERVGAKGAMLCYRNETPIAKITVSAKHPTHPGRVEILGTGQQFVTYGVHPDTGKPYIWTNALAGGEPRLTPLDKLPEVTPDKLRDFTDKVAELLKGLGYTDVKVSGRGEPTGEVRLDAPVYLELDTLFNIDRARTWLRSLVDRGEVAVEGQGGDDRTYRVACNLRDLGLTADNALAVLLEPDGWNENCRPPWGCEELGVKVRNAYKYGKNAPGALAVPASFMDLPQLEVAGATTSTPDDKAVERFRSPVPKLMPADFDPTRLPQRPFVLGYRFLAGAVTLGVAAPGTGKSNFAILTALSIATGQSLTGEQVYRSGPVWLHNNVDSLDELYRRISGVLSHHHIEFGSVRNNIFATSGLDERLIVAIKGNDIVARSPALSHVIASIKESGIVHMVIDPFVSTHRGVSENANEEVEQVAEAIRHIAHETGCSVDLVHHSIKSHARDTESHAGDMNAARGASALIGAVRIVYTLAPMNTKTATSLNIPPQLSARLIRLDQGKGNYSARDPSIRWFELLTVPIGNGANTGDVFLATGDTVAVAVPWTPAPANPIVPTADNEAETKRQRVRDIVATEMPTDRCQVIEVVPAVQKEFGLQKSAARKLVMNAISAEHGSPAQARGELYVLMLEREEPSPPKPVFVVRTAVGLDAGNGAGGRVASATSHPTEIDKEAANDELEAGNPNAFADLVPA